MKLLKSKAGFTLIELLVVIGILAVLAAIAIPSVAGLIDRANRSSDQTNAKEMTNAIERFASEYEIYAQDILADRLDITNLSAYQNRVYNITNIINRQGLSVTELDVNENQTGTHIFRNTKYPINAGTARKIIETYMKTSSSTFEPKQSDMSYWYNTTNGSVVVAETDANIAELDALIGIATGANNVVSESAEWCNLTELQTSKIENGEKIPEGATYYVGLGRQDRKVGDYSGYSKKFISGDSFPSTVRPGDVFVYDGYEYQYNHAIDSRGTWLSQGGGNNGWGVVAIDKNKSSYGMILSYINNEPTIYLSYAFSYCTNLVIPPQIPNTIIKISNAFTHCTFEVAPDIPDSVLNGSAAFAANRKLKIAPSKMSTNLTTAGSMFKECTELRIAPDISNCSSLTYVYDMFYNCEEMTGYIGNKDANGDFSNWKIPDSVTNMGYLFAYCDSISAAPTIPERVENIGYSFVGCRLLSGDIVMNANPSTYSGCFSGTVLPIKIIGNTSVSTKQTLASTNTNISFE